jgi:hypothetical protein
MLMNDEKFALAIIGVIAMCFMYVVFTATRQPTSDELNNPVLLKIRENFSKIDPSYGSIPIVLSTRGAYTEDKKYIAMCINDPITGRQYDFDEIMYVSLHELAHYISKSYGHNAEFLRNFDALLARAQRVGVYHSINPPETYCE